MDRKACLVLLILAISWCCSAHNLTAADLKRESLDVSEKEVEATNEKLCSLCQKLATKALSFLSNTDTQKKITDFLLKACSVLPLFKEQCTGAVNKYTALVFLAIHTLKPEKLCQEIHLCDKAVVSISQNVSNSSCDLCHQAVVEVMQKVKNPDTQEKLLELLLKACDSANPLAAKCKTLVSEYVPVILANVEQFLETNDVCTMLQVCNLPTLGMEQALPMMEESANHSAY